MHTPVLLKESILELAVTPGGRYIDATYGEGGHTNAILEAGGIVLAIDRDPSQIAKAKKSNSNLKLVAGNFADIESIAQENKFTGVDGILFDLGLSYGQLIDGGRGLSFKNPDELLDMRLDESADRTAEQILRRYSHEELVRVFMENAEEIQSEQIVTAIEEGRKTVRNLTVGWLTEVLENAHLSDPKRSILRVFQALRIEVNNEFNNLRKGLEGASKIVRPGGVVVVISFHSLEDRIVKQFIRSHGFKQNSKKPVKGDEGLSFERSALLRSFYL